MLAAYLARRTCRRMLKAPIFALTPTSLFHSLEAASSPLLDISQFHIKGFSETYDPILGRAIHGLMVKTFFVHDIIHFNTLVNMYVRFGDLDAARCVFDEMPEKNRASWSTMVSGYVKWCLFYEAAGLFRQMQWHGMLPNGFVVASLISGCTLSGTMTDHGIGIHGLVVKIGLLDDVYVSSAFVHFYAVYGFLDCARQVFEEMEERNIVSWTSLIVGYSKNGEPEKSVDIYLNMKREGVVFNPNSVSAVISACALLEDELVGHQVLAHVIRLGLLTNNPVANSLINMLGNIGCVEDASDVFDAIEEVDKISWNSIISAYAHNGLSNESLDYFHAMRQAGEDPDSTTFSSLISACSSVDNKKMGLELHGLLIKHGFDSFVCVSNTLITLYSMLGDPNSAALVFCLTTEKDLISWNSLMAALVQNGKCEESLNLLVQMLVESKGVNHVTLSCAIAACSTTQAFDVGEMVHAFAIVGGFRSDLIVGNSLITMYSKCGAMERAKRVFNTMPETDMVTWNAFMGGYADNELKEDALSIFNSQRKLNIKTNYITLVTILSACSAVEDLLKCGMPIHAHVLSSGFESDIYVKNSLLTMYAKCGDLISSNVIFCALDVKTIVSWNAIIGANAHQGQGEEALKLFMQMRRECLEFDQFSLSGVFAAAAALASLEQGQQLHNLVIKFGFEASVYVNNAVIDMYGKCGTVENIAKVVPDTMKRTRLTWNTLVSVYARHGIYFKARETFEEMLKVGEQPDYVTFVCLLSACNHSGLVDEGLRYFGMMNSKFGIEPGIEHCVCVVDLLGRSGRLLEAEKFIKNMPVKPNDVIWRSLLAASRIHRNLELGRLAAKHLLELDPYDDSAHVLLSNICAVNGIWADVMNIRVNMQVQKVKKKPACSWLNVKNKVISFGIGDMTHPQTHQIYSKLKDLQMIIKEAGYVADTSFVLHDMDEEQKEQNLWNHSEKIALAFGLINTPESSILRIFKNLRVCGDCHSVYKYVSAATKREIVLRDPYRFHHFRSGQCSCSDYW